MLHHLPGAASTFADIAWATITVLRARGTLLAVIRRLAAQHTGCSHSAEIAAVLRNWDGAVVATFLPEQPPLHLRLTNGREIDILPYAPAWSGLTSVGAKLNLYLDDLKLEIEAFPWLLCRGAAYQRVSHAVGESSQDEGVADICAPRQRSTYSYFPLGRGRGPAFDITVGQRVLLIDIPSSDVARGHMQTLLIEYDLP